MLNIEVKLIIFIIFILFNFLNLIIEIYNNI